jgi:hypothetical protein
MKTSVAPVEGNPDFSSGRKEDGKIETGKSPSHSLLKQKKV